MFTIEDKRRFLHLLPYWDELTPEERLLLEQQSIELKYRKGKYINMVTLDAGILIVCQGRLRVSVVSEEGREITLNIHKPKTIAPLITNPIPDIPFHFAMEAEEDLTLLIVPESLCTTLRRAHEQIGHYHNELSLSIFTGAIWTLQKMMFVNVEQRLVEYLLEESEFMQSDVLYLTHQQIAKSLGTAREVVTRTLKNYTTRGLIECARGRIVLLDKKGLRSINEL